MKVKDLIEHLKQFDGELEVYAFTDHGQTPQLISPPQIIYAGDSAYTLWDEWVVAPDEADEYGYQVKAVLL